MGNRKFRLSDMMSGSWLYKFRDTKNGTTRPKSHRHKPSSSPVKTKAPTSTTTTTTTTASTPYSSPRKSYHFPRELNANLVDSHAHLLKPPQHEKTTEPKKKPIIDAKCITSSSSSSSTSTSNTTFSPPHSHPRPRRVVAPSPDFRFDRVLTPDLVVDKTTSSPSSSTSRPPSDPDHVDAADHDITVDMVTPLGLSPIMTTRKKKTVKPGFRVSSSANSPGMKLRVHSPRLLAAARRMQARKGVQSRKSDHANGTACRGFAVVKSSFNPQRDFRDSMVEMIVENKIKDAEDLEELLACYLSLNSEEYHEVIITVFKQIWCDLTDARFK